MPSSFFHFFSPGPFSALLATIALLVITIFLVAKRWIGLSSALILLLISLATGILINNPKVLDDYSQTSFAAEIEHQENFNKQILQAIDGVKEEVSIEKENINQLRNQIEDILLKIDQEKQKVENFIDETRKHFQTEHTAIESTEHASQG